MSSRKSKVRILPMTADLTPGERLHISRSPSHSLVRMSDGKVYLRGPYGFRRLSDEDVRLLVLLETGRSIRRTQFWTGLGVVVLMALIAIAVVLRLAK